MEIGLWVWVSARLSDVHVAGLRVYQIKTQNVLENVPIDVHLLARCQAFQYCTGSALEDVGTWAYQDAAGVEIRLMRTPLGLVQLNAQHELQ